MTTPLVFGGGWVSFVAGDAKDGNDDVDSTKDVSLGLSGAVVIGSGDSWSAVPLIFIVRRRRGVPLENSSLAFCKSCSSDALTASSPVEVR